MKRLRVQPKRLRLLIDQQRLSLTEPGQPRLQVLQEYARTREMNRRADGPISPPPQQAPGPLPDQQADRHLPEMVAHALNSNGRPADKGSSPVHERITVREPDLDHPVVPLDLDRPAVPQDLDHPVVPLDPDRPAVHLNGRCRTGLVKVVRLQVRNQPTRLPAKGLKEKLSRVRMSDHGVNSGKTREQGKRAKRIRRPSPNLLEIIAVRPGKANIKRKRKT